MAAGGDEAVRSLSGHDPLASAAPQPGAWQGDLDGYIALKMQEVTKCRAVTQPLEYQMHFGI